MPCTFQSTPSARRATLLSVFQPVAGIISIHALREEGDREPSNLRYTDTYFNPRPPRGERPSGCFFPHHGQKISIHALREESDFFPTRPLHRKFNFNPRPPRGERQKHGTQETSPERFQSTPSARRATASGFVPNSYSSISIHALREESDIDWTDVDRGYDDFNPRPPRGERHDRAAKCYVHVTISIHALREESDRLRI